MIQLPHGFRLSGVACGIKSVDAEDLTLIVADGPCVAAGVYTLNQVVAAPVVLDRQRTPSGQIRAVVTNSGNANACTGDAGMQDAQRMTDLTAELVGCKPEQVLVMSTGIIGEPLPMDKVEPGIRDAFGQLGNTEEDLFAAARGIMTTDTQQKIAHSQQGDYRVVGIAKGSGMIGPKMATMLGTVLTDAPISPPDAQRLLSEVVERSFNAINVDGHTSTNDTVLLLASGDGAPLAGEALDAFAAELEQVCTDLAKQIVVDGEGASHLVEIVISGAQTDDDARTIAEAIANSPLVKTAIAGNDPNWGRIVSAAGYAGPLIDVSRTSLTLNGVQLYKKGTPVRFDAAGVSKAMQDNRNVLIELVVGQGSGNFRFWTCDLTHEYVSINADYHT